MLPVGTKSMIAITHRITGGDKVASFTHYWERTDGMECNAIDAVALADYFHVEVGSHWDDFADTQYAISVTKAVCIKEDGYVDATSTEDPIPGTLGDLLPEGQFAMGSMISVLLQKRTGRRGRRYMGRLFVPGLNESLNVNGYLTSIGQGHVDDLCASLGTSHDIAPGEGPGFEVAARHWTPDQRNAEGDLTSPADFVVVTDMRYVDQLVTRKDRVLKGNRIAR